MQYVAGVSALSWLSDEVHKSTLFFFTCSITLYLIILLLYGVRTSGVLSSSRALQLIDFFLRIFPLNYLRLLLQQLYNSSRKESNLTDRTPTLTVLHGAGRRLRVVMSKWSRKQATCCTNRPCCSREKCLHAIWGRGQQQCVVCVVS